MGEARPARTREEETEHLLALYDGDATRVLALVDGQLQSLAARAQTLLSLTGITITVTGFSGANIAKTSVAAAVLIVAGLVFVLVGAALCIGGILVVRWTTQIAPCPPRDAVLYALENRDRKTLAYGRALTFVILGLSTYVASVALLLLNALLPQGRT